MDLPLKVEVSKLSHVHILQVLVPFLPGTVIMGGLALGSPWIAEQMRVADIGYRTKLFLAFVLTYMIGFAFMTVTSNANGFVLGLIQKNSQVQPWDNPYWRRVVVQYLGTDLIPLIPESTDAVSAEYLAALARQPGGLKDLAKIRESTEKLDKQLTTLEENIRRLRETNAAKVNELIDPKADQIAKWLAINRDQKQQLEIIERGLGDLTVRTEWRSLHQALMNTFTDMEPPYESLSSALGALQAAGIAAMWVMIQYPKLWNWSAAIFSVLLIIVATYGLRQVFRMTRFLGQANSPQVSAMIREMKKIRG